jgi:hypothetical protein
MSDHRKQQFFCDPNGNQPVEDECTLELLLTSQATSDPPITQELVEHLIADFAEFEEVYQPKIGQALSSRDTRQAVQGSYQVW